MSFLLSFPQGLYKAGIQQVLQRALLGSHTPRSPSPGHHKYHVGHLGRQLWLSPGVGSQPEGQELGRLHGHYCTGLGVCESSRQVTYWPH